MSELSTTAPTRPAPQPIRPGRVADALRRTSARVFRFVQPRRPRAIGATRATSQTPPRTSAAEYVSPQGQKPAWPGEPPSCGACGRRLLAGETAVTYHVAEHDVAVCPLCAARLGAAGLRRTPLA